MRMKNDRDDADENYEEEEYESGFLRWMSVFVVLVAVGGFFALAWYAYHTGTQSIAPEDVALVQAEKTPVKEAPADPGGQQFPHQDKTVYENIASDPKARQNVERVLPAPEEPVKMDGAATPQAESWVNSTLPGASSDVTSQVAQNAPKEAPLPENAPDSSGLPSPAIAPLPMAMPPKNASAKTEEALKAEDAADATATKEPAAASPAPAVKNPAEEIVAKPMKEEPVKEAAAKEKPATAVPPAKPMTEKPPVEKEKPVKPVAEKEKSAPATVAVKAIPAKPVTAKNAAKPAKTGGTAQVQLGAFKSEAEAGAVWAKLVQKHGAALAGASHSIQRADIPGKGTYYRLRAGGLAGEAAAKSLCAQLSAKGQACFPVPAK